MHLEPRVTTQLVGAVVMLTFHRTSRTQSTTPAQEVAEPIHGANVRFALVFDLRGRASEGQDQYNSQSRLPICSSS
jgi:hypothetical protein